MPPRRTSIPSPSQVLRVGWLVGGLAASAALTSAQEAPSKELHIYCWTEYIPDSVVEAFTQETGVAVFVENYSSNDELLRRRLVGGRHDLIQPSDHAVEALIKADALEPIDRARIPNLRHLDARFTSLPHDPEGRYSVPWMAGTVGIVVNTSKVKEPIQGFGDVFSGKYAGRIAALGDTREWAAWALAFLGRPINEVTPENLARIEAVWREWIPQVAVFDSDSPHSALVEGKADVGIVWSGEGAILLEEHRGYQFVLPAEGAHRFVDCLAIPRGARHKEHAEAFIDFILRPEISVMISGEYPYTNPNAEAVKRLTQQQRNNPASYPPTDLKLESLRDIGSMTEQLEKLFNRIRWSLRPQ